MAYSMKTYPNEGDVLPPPPPWCVWIADYSHQIQMPMIEGQVRHYSDTPQDLKKLKGHIRGYTLSSWMAERDGRDADAFTRAWTVYKWDLELGRYVLMYQGQVGESAKESPLFQRKPSTKPRRNKQQEAIALIHEALERQARKVA